LEVKKGKKMKLQSQNLVQLVEEDFMLGNPNSQRAAHSTQKTFCSKMLKINRGDDFEQKVFLSAMRCALGFPNIKSSGAFMSRRNFFFVLKRTNLPSFRIFLWRKKRFCFFSGSEVLLSKTDKLSNFFHLESRISTHL